jgi:NhaP-type Na+/H+ or K+/H+ antiporter/rhodanese-related sulfurtransferase
MKDKVATIETPFSNSQAMTDFNPELFLSTLALIGVVIVLSALLSGFVERSGLPQVAVFLALGAAIGPYGLGLINVDVHSPILRVVGTLSLVLVLFTDAVSLNLSEVRKHQKLSVLVLGPGTLFSAFIIALFSYWLLGLSLGAALILGAGLASTDPVMLRGLLGKPRLNPAVRQALRLEGGMNDAVLLPIVIVGMTMLHGDHSLEPTQWAHLGMSILILSPAAGIVVALAAIGMLELVRKQIGVRRDYESIYSLGVAFAAFAAGEAVHGSGFLAAFAAGLVISAMDLELCDCFLEYGETTGEMALMFAFVLFGVSVIWKGLGTLGTGTLLFVAAVFAARPLAFLPALWPSGLSWKNRALIAWFGPRGLSSLLLVLLPVFEGLPHSEYLLTICCLVVLFSVVLHGLTPSLLTKTPIQVPASSEASSAGSEVQARVPTLASDAPPINSTGQLVPVQNSAATHSVLRASSRPEFISMEEVKALRSIPGRVVITDARSEKTYEASGQVVPGAVRVNPQQAVRSATELGLRKDTMLAVFCACPNDETSLRVAGELRKAGWVNTRAIEGGWNAWINAGMPVESRLTSK